MVITRPMPSMPVCLWGDDAERTKYSDAYFREFPASGSRGFFFRISERGGCYVLGRSDAALRHGVRIGTAAIYAVLAGIEAILDALMVSLDLPGSGSSCWGPCSSPRRSASPSPSNH